MAGWKNNHNPDKTCSEKLLLIEVELTAGPEQIEEHYIKKLKSPGTDSWKNDGDRSFANYVNKKRGLVGKDAVSGKNVGDARYDLNWKTRRNERQGLTPRKVVSRMKKGRVGLINMIPTTKEPIAVPSPPEVGKTSLACLAPKIEDFTALHDTVMNLRDYVANMPINEMNRRVGRIEGLFCLIEKQLQVANLLASAQLEAWDKTLPPALKAMLEEALQTPPNVSYGVANDNKNPRIRGNGSGGNQERTVGTMKTNNASEVNHE